MKAAQIYEGTVRHRRFIPKGNTFLYRLKMWYLDVDQLPSADDNAWWSPFRFERQDYFDETGKPLKEAVIDYVKQSYPEKSIDKVYLLTQLRCFGYVINPLSIYYCFSDGRLQAIVAEVTNTPWGEKKRYVLDSDSDCTRQQVRFQKQMHVSPFNPMNMHYEWTSNVPDEALSVHLSCWFDDKKHVDATLLLKRSRCTMTPWMTWKIVTLIYWQAAKLFFIKRIPFYSHKPKAVD